jgi:two-component system LytT family sensor kinase
MPSLGAGESSRVGETRASRNGTFTSPPAQQVRPLLPARRTALNALAIFGVWTTLGLLSCAQGALFLAQAGQHLTWGGFAARMLDWYTCAIFTPFFFWLAAHFPVDRRRWRVNVLVQLAGSTVAVVVKYAFLYWFWQRTRPDPRMTFARVLESNFIIESMIIWAVIAIIHGMLFYRRWQEREQLAIELRSRLSEAQLEVLKGQLRPHFLFNTLNSISTLVHSDPASADRMVVQLADLLRASLETSGKHEIPLAEELALLERYVDIMRVRHEDRLTVTIRATPRARAALVPHFILQPLVENAIEHGIGRRAGSGRIVVEAADAGDQLHLRIGDDGSGMPSVANGSPSPDEGVGLGNTRHRLQQLYGEAHSFTIDRAENGGTLVSITMPLRRTLVAQEPLAPAMAMT